MSPRSVVTDVTSGTVSDGITGPVVDPKVHHHCVNATVGDGSGTPDGVSDPTWVCDALGFLTSPPLQVLKPIFAVVRSPDGTRFPQSGVNPPRLKPPGTRDGRGWGGGGESGIGTWTRTLGSPVPPRSGVYDVHKTFPPSGYVVSVHLPVVSAPPEDGQTETGGSGQRPRPRVSPVSLVVPVHRGRRPATVSGPVGVSRSRRRVTLVVGVGGTRVGRSSLILHTFPAST